jgi:hypothetical protein
MADDNIIGIGGRHAAQLRRDQAKQEKREAVVRAAKKERWRLFERHR